MVVGSVFSQLFETPMELIGIQMHVGATSKQREWLEMCFYTGMTQDDRDHSLVILKIVVGKHSNSHTNSSSRDSLLQLHHVFLSTHCMN